MWMQLGSSGITINVNVFDVQLSRVAYGQLFTVVFFVV